MPQPKPSRTASTYWVDAGTRWIGGSVETAVPPRSTRCCIRSFASNTTSGATLSAAVVSAVGEPAGGEGRCGHRVVAHGAQAFDLQPWTGVRRW